MNVEEASRENILRLTSAATGRAQMWRRWMHVLEMRAAGMDWADIGRVINRAASTAQRLYAKAVLETQKMAAICPQCGERLKVISTRYAGNWDKDSRHGLHRPDYNRVLFRGWCDTHGAVWSEAFAKDQPVYHTGIAYARPNPPRPAKRRHRL